MKQILLILSVLVLVNNVSFTQNRSITYTANIGELNMHTHWHTIYYQLDPIFDSCHYHAVCRLTENGKKLAIQYNIDIIAEQYHSPDSIMYPYAILADATSGVIYAKTHYVKSGYSHSSLWVSFDYGKNWIHKREIIGNYNYFGTCAVEGTIYTSDANRNILRSKDYGSSFEFDFFLPLPYSSGITAYQECEFYGLGGSLQQYELHYTDDCAKSFIINPIDAQFIFAYGFGSPDVYRGGLSGEVYVSSWFPDNRYRVSFSADTGHTFRHVYVSDVFHALDDSKPIFMSDREPGVFYIIRRFMVQDTDPWGDHTKVCIEYYQDYGETLVDTYCHDLHKNYGKSCEAVNDLVSEKINEQSILLTWSEPESSLPVVEYWVYRKVESRNKNYELRITNYEIIDGEYELVGVTKGTTFLDEDLPLGEYEYYVVAHYEMGCVADSSNHVKVEIEVGIDEYLQPNFTIIPNPATNQVTISSATPFHSVEIINFLGQTVVSQSAVGNIATVNVSNLNNGVYFVRVGFEGGGSVRKLVKQ